MAVLVVIFLPYGGPEAFILTLSGDEFLLKWNSVGWFAEYLECSEASSQCGPAVEPLVMNGTQGTVTAIDFCNDKQLVALTHSCSTTMGYECEE